MKTTLAMLAAVALVASSSAFAAGEKRAGPAKNSCTFEICHKSAMSHGHSSDVAARWCSAHMATGDACKNVGK